MKTKRDELKTMSEQTLETRVDELRRELFKLRLNAATSPSKSFASIKNGLKKDIARTLTMLQQKYSQQ
jgi:ribosomal protein L29